MFTDTMVNSYKSPETKKRAELTDRMLDRFSKYSPPDSSDSLNISLGGKTLSLHYSRKRDRERAARSFAGLLSIGNGEDGSFFHLRIRPEEIFGKNRCRGIWSLESPRGMVCFVDGTGAVAADLATDRYYFISGNFNSRFPKESLFIRPLSFWARQNGFFIVHAAAVEYGGKAFLLTGKGGSGKSTLTAACVLSGIRFLGDDYILINETGNFKVWPVYSSLFLDENSSGQLKPRLPVISKGLKTEYDAGRFLCSGPISAEAILHLSKGGSSPKIISAAENRGLVECTASTSSQTGLWRNHDAEKLFRRLGELNRFRFVLSADASANAQCLKNFMKERANV